MRQRSLDEILFYIKPFFGRFIAISLLLYLLFHLFYGQLGIISFINMQSKITDAYGHLEQLRSERCIIEHETKALRPESLDLDVLDEVARTELGYSNPKEEISINDMPK